MVRGLILRGDGIERSIRQVTLSPVLEALGAVLNVRFERIGHIPNIYGLDDVFVGPVVPRVKTVVRTIREAVEDITMRTTEAGRLIGQLKTVGMHLGQALTDCEKHNWIAVEDQAHRHPVR